MNPEAILWVVAGIALCIIVVAVAITIRCMRHAAGEMAGRRKRFEADRRRWARMADHRYDPKQFRRG